MQTHRTDANQAAIVRALRQAGASVCNLASVGGGCPDLLVGFAGHNYLLEIKNLEGHRLRYTPAERGFMDAWRGHVYVVTDVPQALAVLDAAKDI